MPKDIFFASERDKRGVERERKEIFGEIDKNVRVFYEENAGRVVILTKREGKSGRRRFGGASEAGTERRGKRRETQDMVEMWK